MNNTTSTLSFLIIPKAEILATADYNLTASMYRKQEVMSNSKWEMVELGEVIKINFGQRITKSKSMGDIYPVYGGGGESFRTDNFNRENEIVIARFAMGENNVRYVECKIWMMDSGGTFEIVNEKKHLVSKKYVGISLLNMQEKILNCARGNAQKNLNNEQFYKLKIPLPPLSVQEEIVREIEGNQKMIDENKKLFSIFEGKIKEKIYKVFKG